MRITPGQRKGWRGMLRAATLLASLAALLAACGPPAPGTATPEATTPEETGGQEGGELAGTEWLLTSLRGQELLEGSRITLQFQANQLGGFAGCNSYGSVMDEGGYEARDGELRLPTLAQTLMACLEPEGVMDQEAAYMDALREATAYRLEGDVLEVQDASGDTILTFRRQEEIDMDPAPLAGTAWQLVTLNGQPPAADSNITLTYLDESRASGHAGCRDYLLGYEASEKGINFYYTAMVGDVCLEPHSPSSRDILLRQEGAFTDALSWTDRFRLAEGGEQLELLSARGESLVFERLAPAALPPLEGPTWVLLSTVEYRALEGLDRPLAAPLDVISGSEVTLQFAQGAVGGTAGCNQYSAAYSLRGAALSIDDPISTKMFCQEPPGVMEQEQRFLSWLAHAAEAQVHGRQLWLDTDDGRALVFHAPDWE
jgi:heat shock protein HslJ